MRKINLLIWNSNIIGKLAHYIRSSSFIFICIFKGKLSERAYRQTVTSAIFCILFSEVSTIGSSYLLIVPISFGFSVIHRFYPIQVHFNHWLRNQKVYLVTHFPRPPKWCMARLSKAAVVMVLVVLVRQLEQTVQAFIVARIPFLTGQVRCQDWCHRTHQRRQTRRGLQWVPTPRSRVQLWKSRRFQHNHQRGRCRHRAEC